MFGLQVLPDFTHRYVGPPGHPDPRFFIWAMAWWPHAILHGLNPIWTGAVWAPAGYNLAWATGVPGPSLIMAPVTLTAGPVASYNALALLAGPLAATAAYLLCRHLTGRFWPSLLAGWVFGFSTYEVAHAVVQVNLELVFLVPLAIHLVLLRVDGVLGRRPFVAALTLLLVAQFLISTEIFATLAVFGAIAVVIGFVVVGADRRGALAEVAGAIALSFALAMVVVSPYLYYVLAHGVPRRRPFRAGADLLSYVLPTTMTGLRASAFDHVIERLPGSLRENTAYVSPPLVAVLAAFAVTRWRTVAGKVLLWSFGIVWVATLGERLFVGGHPTVPLPWRVVGTMPLLNNAFPRRFTMFLFLLLAVMLAMWLSASRRPRATWAVALLVPVFLFPGSAILDQHASVTVPRFFETGTYRRYIAPQAIIVIVPTTGAGDPFRQSRSMVIQAETGFSFRMLVGYTGPQPPRYQRSTILQALTRGEAPAVAPPVFRRVLRSNGVAAIVLDEGSTFEPALTALLGRPPLAVEDVLLYAVDGDGSVRVSSVPRDQAASRRFFLPRAM